MQTKFHVALLLVAFQLAGASPIAEPLSIGGLSSLGRTSSTESRLTHETTPETTTPRTSTPGTTPETTTPGSTPKEPSNAPPGSTTPGTVPKTSTTPPGTSEPNVPAPGQVPSTNPTVPGAGPSVPKTDPVLPPKSNAPGSASPIKCKRGPGGCDDGGTPNTPQPGAGQKRPPPSTNPSSGPGDTKTQKNNQGGSNPGGPSQDLQDRISNLPEYKGPTDLGKNQGTQAQLGNDKTHQWMGNQIYKVKNPPNAQALDNMAMNQAKHTTQQQAYKDMKGGAPNDLSAVYRPVNHPDCSGVMCMSTNVRGATKPVTKPNQSTFEKTQTDALPKDKQKAKDTSNQQGVHGEINAAEHLSNFMGDDPKNPKYPDGSMTTSLNLKDPKNPVFQASCNGASADCKDKMHNMNIQDLHPHAQGPKGAPAVQRKMGTLDPPVQPKQSTGSKRRRDVLLRRALDNFLIQERMKREVLGVVDKRDLLMPRIMGPSIMMETY